jgi:hypothetical protein
VRLTNWDARFLSRRIRPGVPVHFTDIQGRAGGQSYGDQGMSGSGGARSSQGAGTRADSAASAASQEPRAGTHGTPGGRSRGDTTKSPRDTTRT